jgi:hypothetical protein
MNLSQCFIGQPQMKSSLYGGWLLLPSFALAAISLDGLGLGLVAWLAGTGT